MVKTLQHTLQGLGRASPFSFTVLVNLLAVYIIWGSTYYGLRVALTGFPPFLLLGTRFTAAGVILLAFLRWRGAPRPTRQQWGHAAIVGILLLGFGNGGVTFAEQWVASSLAAAIVATNPLWVAVLAGILGKWPSRLEWVGILIGLAGVIVLNLGGDLRAHPLGAVALIIAPMCWAFGSVLSWRLNVPQGLMGAATEMLCAGLFLLGVSAFQREALTAMPSLEAWGAWVYLVTFGSLIGFSAFTYLIRNVRPALATSYAYVNPVVALFIGVLLGGEQLSGVGYMGIAICVLGVLFISVARHWANPASASH
jgi:drug/metabolite transporter (DMT)-like permease